MLQRLPKPMNSRIYRSQCFFIMQCEMSLSLPTTPHFGGGAWIFWIGFVEFFPKGAKFKLWLEGCCGWRFGTFSRIKDLYLFFRTKVMLNMMQMHFLTLCFLSKSFRCNISMVVFLSNVIKFHALWNWMICCWWGEALGILHVRTGFGYIVEMEMYSFSILALWICQVWIFDLQFAGDKFLTPSLSDEWFEFAYKGYALMPNAHASCMASNLVCYTVVAPLPVFCQTLLNFTLFGPGW